MTTKSLHKTEVEITDDWELQVRAYLSMMSPEEQADTIARLQQLILDWKEESGLGVLDLQRN